MNDEELRQLRAESIGMVFQNMALLPHRTVRDNVGFALELRGVDSYQRSMAADETIAKVDLTGYRRPLPLGAFWRHAAAGRIGPCAGGGSGYSFDG